MSETILKEKQLKKALRNKKNNKQTIKNVLSTSEELYWPIIKGNDLNVLKNALESYLPRIRPQKVSIKYSEIQNLKKEERKEYRLKRTEVVKYENNDNESLTFGLNQVNRLVINKTADFVLISSNVSPRFILEGLIRDCTFYKVPYLLVPDLKAILQERCGIKSMIIGFKNCKISENLGLLKRSFEDVYKNYDLNLKCDELKNDLKQDELKKEELKINFEPDDVYLKRKDKNGRVFQPSCCTLQNDFIGFESIKFKPLVVKRIKSDSERNKKKLKTK
nr:uncharacterized protein LOC111418364 [Onthophagus taurus]